MASIEAAQRDQSDDVGRVEALLEGRKRLLEQLRRVIVGQQEVIDGILITMFCRGHAVMEGVPGLAKTLLVRTIARILDLRFNRIQFTPDLMPSDILGTELIEEDPATGRREFKFVRGPVFSNMILADEVNRTPPKTQAALLQAMEERHVTVSGKTYDLEAPFFVLATQNPIEQEGTYPLPEAQLDRFMFMIRIEYPTPAEEVRIVKNTTAGETPQLERVLTAEDVVAIQQVVRRIPVSDALVEYAVRLVGATRPQAPDAPDFVQRWVRWGAGPRASQFLVLGAKARAVMRGELAVAAADIQAVTPLVLRHRIVTNFHAESEGITSDEVIKRVLEAVKV
jgi:MoxR-like ATPase